MPNGIDDKTWELLIDKINGIEKGVQEIKEQHLDKLDSVSKKVHNIEVKLAAYGSIFGAVGAYLKTKLNL